MAGYWVALGLAAGCRASWWLDFIWRSRADAKPKHRLKVLYLPLWQTVRANLRMSTYDRLLRQAAVGRTRGTDWEDPTDAGIAKQHERALGEFRDQRLDAFALGGLSLAAWAALAADDESPVVDAHSVRLLFVGAAITIFGPVLFREGGLLGTWMGLQSTIAIGYTSIALALASMLPDAFGSPSLELLGLTIAAALVIREAISTWRGGIQVTRLLFPAPPPAAPPVVSR